MKFYEFKSEIKLFFIVALIAVILVAGGALLLKTIRPQPVVQTPPLAPLPLPVVSPGQGIIEGAVIYKSDIATTPDFPQTQGTLVVFPAGHLSSFLGEFELPTPEDSIWHLQGGISEEVASQYVIASSNLNSTGQFSITSGEGEFILCLTNATPRLSGEAPVRFFGCVPISIKAGEKLKLGINFGWGGIAIANQEIEKIEIDTSNWQTYRNEEFGFEVKYPAGEEVTQTNYGQRLILPVEEKGTNLSKKYLDITIDGPAPHAGAVISTGQVSVGGRVFTREISAGVAAGNFYEIESYTTNYEGREYILSFAFHSTNLDNYDPSIRPKAFNKVEERKVFDQILSTFRFVEGGNIEAEFEASKANLSVSTSGVGEDATSGTAYTIYRDGNDVRAIRQMWNGGCCSPPGGSYFYFTKVGLSLVKELQADDRNHIDEVLNGSDEYLSVKERFFFEDAKMVRWVKRDGVEVKQTDPEWQRKEQGLLQHAYSLKFIAKEQDISGWPASNADSVATADWQTYRNEGYEFKYPKDFGLDYVRAHTWPPKITATPLNTGFSCENVQGFGNLFPPPHTKEMRVFNGTSYCVVRAVEGAAGTMYAGYKYATMRDGNMVVLEFTMRSPGACSNYSDVPAAAQCENEKATFNPTALADQILSTFRFDRIGVSGIVSFAPIVPTLILLGIFFIFFPFVLFLLVRKFHVSEGKLLALALIYVAILVFGGFVWAYVLIPFWEEMDHPELWKERQKWEEIRKRGENPKIVADLERSNFRDYNKHQLDDTSGWQTYRNEEFGFEMRYPKDFTIEEAIGVEGVDTFEIRVDALGENREFVRVEVDRKESGLRIWSLADYVDYWKWAIVGHAADRIDSETAFNGGIIQGVQLAYTLPEGTSEIAVLLEQGEYLYAVLGYSNVTKQILSTFRFVE